MAQDDEEFEKLLGEIPGATSVPAQVEELQRTLSPQLDGDSPSSCKVEVVKPINDIRCDALYEDFYRIHSEARKLPTPMENRAICDRLVTLSPKSPSTQLSPFCNRFHSPRTSFRQLEMHQKQQAFLPSPQSEQTSQQLEMQQKRQVFLHSQQSHPQRQYPSPSVAGPFSLSESQQILYSNQSLASAFVHLNLEDNSASEAGVKPNGNSNIDIKQGFAAGCATDFSSGFFSQLGDVVGTPPSFGSASGASLDSVVSTSLSFSDPFSQAVANHSLSNGFPCGPNELLSVPPVHVTEKILRQGSTGSDLHFNGRRFSMVNRDRGLPSDSLLHQQERQNITACSAAVEIQAGNQYHNESGSAREQFTNSVGKEIEYPLCMEMASFIQAQQRNQETSAAALLQKRQMEEERLKYRHCMQHQLLLRQQQLQEQQACFYASLQAQPSAIYSTDNGVHFFNLSFRDPTLGYPQQQTQQRENEIREKSGNRVWKNQVSSSTATAISLLEPAHVSEFGNIYDYYSEGYCGRGDFSPFFNIQEQIRRQSKCNHETIDGGFVVPFLEPSYLKNNLPGRNAGGGQEVSPSMSLFPGSRRRNDALANGHSNGYSHSNGNLVTSQLCHTDWKANLRSSAQGKLNMELSQLINVQQLQLKYTPLEEVEGCIYDIARDQHGCRFLQRKFEEGSNSDIQRIFVEIIHHIVELMTDPFGNYLVQKLLEVCDESQHMEILQKVTGKGRLVTISLNMHGTRAVQKVIETLKSLEQVSMVVYSLKGGVVTLIKDLNGNHVVQRCLQCLNSEDSQFIFDAAISHCVDIATHRHGCCVLQRCVDFASGVQRECLVTEIAVNALVLSQDPFGNYVVQYILDLAMPWITVEVIGRLEGNFAHLAMQKFSSNVVEKCFKLANEENRALISWELMNSSQLGQLLQDPYANYVVQCALANSKGALHASLVEAMKPHLPALRNSPYGKRILSCTDIKK